MSATLTFNSSISQPSAWTVDIGAGTKIYTFDGTTYKYYLNGVLTTSQGTAIITYPASSLAITGTFPAYICYQSIAIDATEARLRALTGRIRNGASQLLYLNPNQIDSNGICRSTDGSGNYATLTGGVVRRVGI